MSVAPAPARPGRRTVVLEMLGLVPGRVGGMESYARNLVHVLPSLDERYVYLAAIGVELRGMAAGTRGVLEEWVADRGGMSVRRLRPLRTLVQSVSLDRQLRRLRPDVLHCLMMVPKPPWGARNMVVTIPDLNFELFPDCWHPADRRAMRWACRTAVAKAEAIVTISEFSKRTLVERYGASPERLHVTHPGVRHDVFEPAPDAAASTALRRELDLPRDVLFFPANTWPHKNHVRLLEALATLRDACDLRPGLVLTGSPKNAHAEVLATIERLGLERQVRWLGYVDEARLVTLYRSVTALVFPSLHEGFGMPLVEGMACGCPVACSSTTGTVETAGDAALTFDPTDASDMARALQAMLTRDELRRDLVRRGLERAAKFTWERTARETIHVYDEVIARAGKGSTP